MIYLSNFTLVEIDLNKMKYLLKNNRDGQKAVYKTTLCVSQLNIDFVDEKDCFFRSDVRHTDNGYIVDISIDKTKLNMSLDKIYFNAYRLETDGGEMEKHLFALNPTMCGKFHVPTRYVMLSDYLTGK